MAYRMMGRLHSLALTVLHRERGQGTVEYVALIMLVAVVLAGVVTATSKANLGSGEIGKTIMEKLKGALQSVSLKK